ncbi:hypothetical protein [Antarcticirhabdus aurantiaca]|uniref:hypothetical protein n=1 Tax=Antarcticirhabdus aurantiaca TaxID=2606717 RepID=UPI00131BEAAF|nr:hypothetical protein [Antarcticirhabdus aurantiaca]
MIEFLIHRLVNCAAGPNLGLDTLILEWLAGQPGFADHDPDPDLPLHLHIVAEEEAERWRQHAYGLVGHPAAAAQLREHLCPGADRWVRREGNRFAAAVRGRHRWYDATGHDEAAAILAATLRAYRSHIEEAPRVLAVAA